jgi:hypothetical protein
MITVVGTYTAMYLKVLDPLRVSYFQGCGSGFNPDTDTDPDPVTDPDPS